MMILASVAAALQNVVGATIASLLGQHPLMGVLAGSATLTGGPATGLAFAPLFEQAGVEGAATLAVAAAMTGIVAGGRSPDRGAEGRRARRRGRRGLRPAEASRPARRGCRLGGVGERRHRGA
jgi:ESS family glutamate:Na+ symporter